jgi:hypothetical protein
MLMLACCMGIIHADLSMFDIVGFKSGILSSRDTQSNRTGARRNKACVQVRNKIRRKHI